MLGNLEDYENILVDVEICAVRGVLERTARFLQRKPSAIKLILKPYVAR